MEMPGRTFVLGGGYRYGFNGMEKESDILGGSRAYTTMHRLYDSNLGRWLSVDPETKQFADLTPYNNNENDPISNTDPNGNCPWCITGLVGAATGALVELGSQVLSNAYQGKPLTDIDYADVGIAAVEGGVIGLTGGLGAAGKVGKTTIKVVNTTTKFASAAGQGAVDAKEESHGGAKSIFGTGVHKKDPVEAGIDAVFNLAGGAVPTGKVKKVAIVAKGATPKQAVKAARQSGEVVTRAKRESIQATAKVNQKARKIANETTQEALGGTGVGAVKNVVGDKTKDKKNGQ
jgi:RHS repeat-associated protein